FIFSNLLLFSCLTVIAQTTDSIHINHVGYYPRAQKIAILTGVPGETDFYIIGIEKNDTAWNGKSGPLQPSKNSSLKTSLIDFTALQKAGKYTIVIPSLGQSHPFTIQPNALSPAAIASLKGYYFIRS